MFLWMFAFNCGVILLYFFAVLPAAFINIALIIIGSICLFCKKLRFVAMLVFGISYAASDAANFISSQWPENRHGEIVQVVGYACSLPEISDGKLSFDFCVEPHLLSVRNSDTRLRFRANVYAIAASPSFAPPFDAKGAYSFSDELHSLLSGMVSVNATLKSPRGTVNFYGGIYETWLFANEYQGTASVKKINADSSACDWSCALAMYRIHILYKLNAATNGYESASFLRAITLGDRSGFTSHDWSVMSNTGTTHLVAISGMHVSFIGVLIFGLFFKSSKLAVRYFVFSPRKYDAARLVAVLGSLVCCFLYVLVSGAAIPVQRAYIMYLVALVFAGYLRFNAYSVLCVALFCVLVIDPRAVLQGATWLSFGAVFVLTLLFSKRVAPQGILQSSFKMNAGIFLSMFGLLAYLSLPVSWSSPVVNLIAVPMVIFLLLPFGALIFLMVVAGCPDVPMFLAVFESLFQYYWKLLVWFSDAGLVTKVNIGSSVFLCLLFVGCINLLPISFRARCASAVMFFLFYNYVPVPKSTRYLVNVLDVGQGTSVQITDAQNTLLYDFGPAYGGTADAGERVILPQLQVQGIRFVDVAVISHNDLDHRGGFESVSNQIDYDMLLAGQPDLLSQSAIDCRTVSTLRAGGLTAEVLWPRFEDVSGHVSSRSLALPNNQSCVLKVMVGGVSVLITGDIDVDIERLLVSLHGDSLRSDVLIVGHHGSATSSSWAFLKTVKPKIAIYSAAYKGRFGHPAKIIEERFQRLGIPTYNTATSGAIALQPVTLSPFNFGYDKKTDSVSRLNSTGADFVSYSGKRIAILEARRERALFWVAY